MNIKKNTPMLLENLALELLRGRQTTDGDTLIPMVWEAFQVLSEALAELALLRKVSPITEASVVALTDEELQLAYDVASLAFRTANGERGRRRDVPDEPKKRVTPKKKGANAAWVRARKYEESLPQFKKVGKK